MLHRITARHYGVTCADELPMSTQTIPTIIQKPVYSVVVIGNTIVIATWVALAYYPRALGGEYTATQYLKSLWLSRAIQNICRGCVDWVKSVTETVDVAEKNELLMEDTLSDPSPPLSSPLPSSSSCFFPTSPSEPCISRAG
ncbi:MAG: hypothetical protein Q9213_001482 [Squamulea squamosa]